MSNSSLTKAKNKLEGLILKYNKKAMNLLRLEDFNNALTMLKKSEQILDEQEDNPDVNSLRAITLNNLGCFYKRTGKPNVALSYLKEALDKETNANADLTNLAGTNLNICAIYSELGRHETALGYALRALHIMRDSYLPSSNLTTTMVIGYHNAGAEYEYLNQRNEAIESYTTGYLLSRDELGEEHPLTNSLRTSLEEASDKLGKIEKLTNQRQEFRIKSGLPLANLRTHSVPRRPPSLPQCGPKRHTQSRDKPRSTNKSLEAELSPLNEDLQIPLSYKILKQEFRPKHTNITIAPANASSSVRFVTGDRLQPMFPDDTSISLPNTTIPSLSQTVKPLARPTHTPNSSTNRPSLNSSTKNVAVQLKPLRSTITNIGDKLNHLQRKISDFANTSKGLKDAAKTPESMLTPSSTVSRVNGDTFRRRRNHAARIIQRWYRDVLTKRYQAKLKVNFSVPKTAERKTPNGIVGKRGSVELNTPKEIEKGNEDKAKSVPVTRQNTDEVKLQIKTQTKIDIYPQPKIELVPQIKAEVPKKTDMKIQTSSELRPKVDAKVQTISEGTSSRTPSTTRPDNRLNSKPDNRFNSKPDKFNKQPQKLESLKPQPPLTSKSVVPKHQNLLKEQISSKPLKPIASKTPTQRSSISTQSHKSVSPPRKPSLPLKPSPPRKSNPPAKQANSKPPQITHLEKTKKAIKIQSIVRMYLIRKRYLHIRNAVIIIQKNIRMYQCRNLYKIIREAIIFIQANYRGYRARKLLENMKKS